MIPLLPMRFRQPYRDEALAGYLSECAERYSAYPSALLELANCPTSLQRVAFLSESETERLAQLLGRQAWDLEPAVFKEAVSARKIQLVHFNGASLRRNHIVTGKRRLSPAAMRHSNHLRTLSLVDPIAFCPDTWTMLTGCCLNPECGRPLLWRSVDHVSRCPVCQSDQRDFNTSLVPPEAREHLRAWTDLIHPLPERRDTGRAQLPDKLRNLDPGLVFDLILGLAGLLGSAVAAEPGRSLQEIAGATEIALHWPRSIIEVLEEDARVAEVRDQSLSTALRCYAQSATTLPEIRSLLIYDLARERACDLGTRAELRVARCRLGGMSVKEAAEYIGIARPGVTRLRRAGLLRVNAVTRGRARLESLNSKSCGTVRGDLEDRMPVAELSRKLGLSEHAIDQLVDAGHIDRLHAPAIDVLFGQSMLRRSSAERFVARLRARVFPTGSDSGDYIPLARAFMAVGGRPKPYGSFVTALFEQGYSLRAPIDAGGEVDMQSLRICPMAIYHLQECGSEFPADSETKLISTVTACEILNCGPANLSILVEKGLLDELVHGGSRFLTMGSLARAARRFISFGEIDARLGYQERSARFWLHGHRTSPAMPGFADRSTVEARLHVGLPYGALRRNRLKLSLDDIDRGAAELTDREWDLVRGWVPRRQRARRGVCDRSVLNGMIWVSATGRRWRDIPARYGEAEACYSRYYHWKRTGTLQTIFCILSRERERELTAAKNVCA